MIGLHTFDDEHHPDHVLKTAYENWTASLQFGRNIPIGISEEELERCQDAEDEVLKDAFLIPPKTPQGFLMKLRLFGGMALETRKSWKDLETGTTILPEWDGQSLDDREFMVWRLINDAEGVLAPTNPDIAGYQLGAHGPETGPKSVPHIEDAHPELVRRIAVAVKRIGASNPDLLETMVTWLEAYPLPTEDKTDTGGKLAT